MDGAMRKIFLTIVLCMIVVEPLSAELKDFHFIPQRRRIIFVEDFYQLYRQNLNASRSAQHTNIYYLQKALLAAETNYWWAHPTKAFAYVRFDWANPPRNSRLYRKFKGQLAPYRESHHAKYKELMKMRISLLLTKSFLLLGSRYDRENIYWFNSQAYDNLPINAKRKKEHYLVRSFKVARMYYIIAYQYWMRTKHYVRICKEGVYDHKLSNTSVLFRDIILNGIEMDKMEDEVNKIYLGGNLDPDKEEILAEKLKKLDIEINRFKSIENRITSKLKQIIKLETTAADRKYKRLVKRYKEEEKNYYMDENYPEFNYDKVIYEKLESLVHKTEKVKQLIELHKKAASGQ